MKWHGKGPVVRSGVYDAARCGLPVMPVWSGAGGAGGYFGQEYRFVLEPVAGSAISAPAVSAGVALAGSSSSAGANRYYFVRTGAHRAPDPSCSSLSACSFDTDYHNGDCSVPTAFANPGLANEWSASSGYSSKSGYQSSFSAGGFEVGSRFWCEAASLHHPRYGTDAQFAAWLADNFQGDAAQAMADIPSGTWFAVVPFWAEFEARGWEKRMCHGNSLEIYLDGALYHSESGGFSWRLVHCDETQTLGSSVGAGGRAVFLGAERHRVRQGMSFAFWKIVDWNVSPAPDAATLAACESLLNQVAFRLETTGPA